MRVIDADINTVLEDYNFQPQKIKELRDKYDDKQLWQAIYVFEKSGVEQTTRFLQALENGEEPPKGYRPLRVMSNIRSQITNL